MQPLNALTKAELHLHIEGTLEPELAFALASRNGLELPFPDVEALRTAYQFDDLGSFLELYYGCSTVLRTAEDFADLVDAFIARAAPQGLRHVELFFDPQAHLARGVPLEVAMAGLAAGVRRADDNGVNVGLIACFLRDSPVADAHRTLEALAPYATELVGVGLDSAEVGFPPSLFADVFAEARQLGLHTVAHAGEEGPPSYVWEAIDVLGAERIDHGVRALEDPALVRRLVADQIPLTVCPQSNVRLKVVDSMQRHMLPAMLDSGLVVCLNSDDPAYFGAYIGEVYAAVESALHLGRATLRDLARNSVEASFIRDDVRTVLQADIDAW